MPWHSAELRSVEPGLSGWCGAELSSNRGLAWPASAALRGCLGLDCLVERVHVLSAGCGVAW